ncbi:MAG: acetyl-CoA C-acetyltransferase [Motiliproteus sp.]
MSSAYIYDAVRTPRGKGKTGGALNEVKPIDLLAGLLRNLQARLDLDTARVDDVVMGCVQPVFEQGSDIARVAVLRAGWDQSVAGTQIDRYCGSGLEAVNLAAAKVMSGWEQLVVAGGVESMSRVPMGTRGGAWSDDPATARALNYIPQGVAIDLLATMEGYSREDVDTFAVESQRRAAVAQANGHFDKSLIAVKDQNGLLILDRDEYTRPGTTVEKLAALKPAFAPMGAAGYEAVALARYPGIDKINYVHHSGNSSGIVDGAAALLIGSEQAGRDLGLKARGRIVAAAVVGSEPTVMLTGPAPAARKALAIAGLDFDDIDLFEVNEAFAGMVLRFMQDTGVAHEKINVNGGSIALGHPLGATGAMLVGTVLDELERRNQRYGMVTLCVAAGMGIATIIERV